MFSSSLTFYYSHYLMCHCQTHTTYTTRLFVILLTTFFCNHYTYSWNILNGSFQKHKADWITTDSLLTLYCPCICTHIQPAECSQCRMFSSSWQMYSDCLYICIRILVCASCLLLLVYLEGVRCICWCVFVYRLHNASCCVCFRCVCDIYIFHAHDLYSCSFC